MSNPNLPRFVEITDKKGFVRDTHSKAVIYTNNDEYRIRKATRDRELQKRKEFEQMKTDVAEIKSLLERLLNAQPKVL
jgi:hypothetical protein